MTDETNPGKVLGKSSQMAIQLTKINDKTRKNKTLLNTTNTLIKICQQVF